MIIFDRQVAQSYLEKIGYYRLSGYWYPYRISRRTARLQLVGDDFRPNTKFSEVVDLYVFDKKLRLLMMDAIERIEIALANSKAKVAGGVQRIADKYGIPRASLRRHMDHHMTQADFARLRLGMPDAIDANIEEVIRQEGEGAILLLRRMKGDHQAAVERWEKLGEFEQARKERIELRKVGGV